MNEARPWKRAWRWLALLVPLFCLSYGFANWLAARRAAVPTLAMSWDHAVPFVPWTIIPYLSLDLLYCLSLFQCTTRSELDRHAFRLLAVEAVCIASFLLFPLRFAFERPDVSGVYAAFFKLLEFFDRPFNQTPSLHIANLIVIWACFARHATPRRRWAWHGWMTLVGVSILTTWQHHLIDLPTGLAVGVIALIAIPIGE